MRSLRNRLALMFFAITFVAIAVLYLYVAPGLQTRLINEKLNALSAAAARYSASISATVGNSYLPPVVRLRVDTAALASGNRVALLSVAQTSAGPQLSPQQDSSNKAAAEPLSYPVAVTAAKTAQPATGLEMTAAGQTAEAAYPVPYQGHVGAVIVFSDPVADIAHSVAVVRHDILVAGGFALLVALIGGYLVARALSQRVKRLEHAAEQVDIGELTRSVSAEFEPGLAQHDAHLELRLTARSADMLCDPVRVAQIMRILLDNALTHTPTGSRIVVTAGREDGRVRLAVRDDGDGIDRAALSRIFEPFYTSDDAQGSGLGLAIASELAERMAGHLYVESGPGRTTFTLELPA